MPQYFTFFLQKYVVPRVYAMALRLSVHHLYVTIRYCTKIAKCRDCSFVVPKILLKFKWNHSNGVQNAVGLGDRL